MTLPTIADYPMPTVPTDGVVTWTLRPQQAALLIHDMQNYFVGAYAPAHDALQQCTRNIARLRALAAQHEIPVLYTAQPGNQHPLRRGLLQDFWGHGLSAGQPAAIISALEPADTDIVIDKWRYSAFSRTDLRHILSRAHCDQLIITGIYAHLGCQTTAIDAYMNDVQPFFVADAMADFSRSHHQGALRYVARSCGRVLSTADIVHDITGH